MSGTLLPNFWELRKVYRRWTSKVPTNKPCRREVYADKVFPTEDAKFDAVVKATREMLAAGRPVLIGTRTVEASKKLSAKLTAVGVEHQVLNAEQNEREAEIVAAAGQPGTVTVATNMAGRGTDIKLGKGVAENGGLHVIGTERHEAERIDRQLQGRAGRQGDPGSAQFMLSLEDQLLEGLGTAKHRPEASRTQTLQAALRPHELRQAPPGDAPGHRGRPVCGLSFLSSDPGVRNGSPARIPNSAFGLRIRSRRIRDPRRPWPDP
jgi:preprotein translocase subunit SecA